jgi:hypothetical protein
MKSRPRTVTSEFDRWLKKRKMKSGPHSMELFFKSNFLDQSIKEAFLDIFYELHVLTKKVEAKAIDCKSLAKR